MAFTKKIGKGKVTFNTDGIKELRDNIDRPGDIDAKVVYGRAKFSDTRGSIAAGCGHVHTECSVVDAEANGPNASADVELSNERVSLQYKAELYSASVSAGPVTLKTGVTADVGFGIGEDGVEAQVMGTGFSIGRKIGLSLFGQGFEIGLW
uniref:Uncharacterized protein n=1 Tax=Stegastes partitus TaxID=144197 RepID=A0A3B5B557_9TELE